MTAQAPQRRHTCSDNEPQPASSRKDLRILLVDDNKLNQQLAAAVLDLDGYQVDVADDGSQAVEAVRKATYDLILMDIQMPVMDGVQAAREIRALPSPKCDVWIIAVTGSGIANSVCDCRAIGMDDYIAKPYNPEVLLEKMDHIAESRLDLVA